MSSVSSETFVSEERPGIWATVKAAIEGRRYDFTEGPLTRAILLLAIPMILEMAMESIFAVVDVFFVGKLGSEAIATVGLTESMLILIYAVGMGLGIGAMAMIARRIGEKRADLAGSVAVQAIALGLIVALPVVVGGVFGAQTFLRWMGGSPWVVERGVRFTQIMLASAPSVLLLFLINASFRGAGDAAISMRVLWLANAINIGLGPCLILGLGPFPRLGVMGAAVATSTGRTIGVCYQLYRLGHPGGRLLVQRRDIRIEPKTIIALLRLSGSAVLQTLIGTSSWIGLVRIVSSFGSAAVAGYTIAIRIILFALLPSWGMSNAAATLVGQNLGANKPDRSERSVWLAGLYNMLFLGAVGGLFLLFADTIVAQFTHEPVVLSYASSGLRIISAGFVFYAYGMVLVQAFNGAGDTKTPTLLNLFCYWLFELPLAYALSHGFHLGPMGAFIAISIAYASSALISALIFRQGHWKLRSV